MRVAVKRGDHAISAALRFAKPPSVVVRERCTATGQA